MGNTLQLIKEAKDKKQVCKLFGSNLQISL